MPSIDGVSLSHGCFSTAHVTMDKMAAIFQKSCSTAFLWTGISHQFQLWLNYHCSSLLVYIVKISPDHIFTSSHSLRTNRYQLLYMRTSYTYVHVITYIWSLALHSLHLLVKTRDGNLCIKSGTMGFVISILVNNRINLKRQAYRIYIFYMVLERIRYWGTCTIKITSTSNNISYPKSLWYIGGLSSPQK